MRLDAYSMSACNGAAVEMQRAMNLVKSKQRVLCVKYGITASEIAFIEKMVRLMDLRGNCEDEEAKMENGRKTAGCAL